MDAARLRFVTGPDAPLTSPSELEIGLLHALQKIDEQHPRLLLALKTKRSFDNVLPHLTSLLGAGAKRLWDDRVRNDLAIKVAGERDFLPFNWPGPVLLMYPDAKMLSDVGKIGQVTAEVVVPWTENPDIEKWKATWNPTPIASGQPAGKVATLHPVARAALQTLKALVNVNNGMIDREKRDTIEILGTLVAFGLPIDSMAVRGWLAREGGWPGEMADAAMDIFDDLKGGRQFRGYNYPDRDRFERWVAAAKEES